jgi:hypothetical protein
VRRDSFPADGQWTSAGWVWLAAGGDEIAVSEFAAEQDFDVSVSNFLQAPITRGFVFLRQSSRSL